MTGGGQSRRGSRGCGAAAALCPFVAEVKLYRDYKADGEEEQRGERGESCQGRPGAVGQTEGQAGVSANTLKGRRSSVERLKQAEQLL